MENRISFHQIIRNFVKTKLTEGYLKFVGKYMHRWLQDNPQEDENGKPMEMGAASQG
jgi:hypothetical protein